MLCRKEESSGILGELVKAYPSSLSTTFCSASCPCKADKSIFPTTSEYSSALFNNNNGASNIYQCPNNPLKDSGVKQSMLGLLGFLESEFLCSGMCTKEKWYYFTDVSRGPPLYKCYDKLMEYINSKIKLIFCLARYYFISAVVIASAIICFLAAACSAFSFCFDEAFKTIY